MDNEKFGIWGRTNLGEIFRFAWIEDSSGVVYDRKIMLLDNNGNNPEEYCLNYEEHIIKHSKKLIDLIEDKDIVEIELSEEFEELFGNTPFENIKKTQQYINKNYIPIQKVREMRDELDRTKAEYMEWQKQELKQKDKIIEQMTYYIMNLDIDEDICKKSKL